MHKTVISMVSIMITSISNNMERVKAYIIIILLYWGWNLISHSEGKRKPKSFEAKRRKGQRKKRLDTCLTTSYLAVCKLFASNNCNSLNTQGPGCLHKIHRKLKKNNDNKHTFICEIWGCHSCEYEGYGLLGSDTI